MRKRKSPLYSFRSAVKDYFTFTVPEKLGIFTLIIFQLVLLGIVLFVNFTPVSQPNNSDVFEKAIKELDDLHRQDSLSRKKYIDSLKSRSPDTLAKEITSPPEYFVFNPNNLPDSLWNKLGFSQKQIRVIKNYESKGGKFFKKEDVEKMYCIRPEKYKQLEPFISIPDTKPEYKKDTLKFAAKKIEPSVVDLNSATTEELQQLPAIGEWRASSILKYREMLGGYTHVEQLKEANGMNDSTFDVIKNFVTLRTMNIRRLNINTMDPQQLKHPYISFSLARVIINYRKMHGDYTAVSDIKKLGIVNDELYKKLLPYLNVQ